MGVLTGEEMENEVRSNLGGRTDLDDRLYRFLNFAQDQLARYHQFDELETLVETTTTAGVGTLSLPSKPLDIRSLRLIDGSQSRKLTYYTPRQFDAMVPDTSWYATERPSIYTAYRRTVELWRIPNDSYTVYLRYKAYPTAFSEGDDDTSDFEGMDDILIALATSWAFRSLGESEKASYWVGVAAKGMQLARNADLFRTDYAPSGTASVNLPAGEYWNNPFIKGVR